MIHLLHQEVNLAPFFRLHLTQAPGFLHFEVTLNPFGLCSVVGLLARADHLGQFLKFSLEPLVACQRLGVLAVGFDRFAGKLQRPVGPLVVVLFDEAEYLPFGLAIGGHRTLPQNLAALLHAIDEPNSRLLARCGFDLLVQSQALQALAGLRMTGNQSQRLVVKTAGQVVIPTRGRFLAATHQPIGPPTAARSLFLIQGRVLRRREAGALQFRFGDECQFALGRLRQARRGEFTLDDLIQQLPGGVVLPGAQSFLALRQMRPRLVKLVDCRFRQLDISHEELAIRFREGLGVYFAHQPQRAFIVLGLIHRHRALQLGLRGFILCPCDDAARQPSGQEQDTATPSQLP